MLKRLEILFVWLGLTLVLGVVTAFATHQGSRVYQGTSRTVVFTFEGNRVYAGSTVGDLSKLVLTFDGTRIYRGASQLPHSVLFTVEGSRIIPGMSSNVQMAEYTIDNGRVYRGYVKSIDNVAYTYSGKRMHRGTQTGNLNNVVYTLDNTVNGTQQFLLPLLADGKY